MTAIERIDFAKVRFIVICLVISAFGLGMLVMMPAQIAKHELPACATEDSSNCFWDAAVQGNGQGTSFVDIDGVAYYPVDIHNFQLPTE
jgi:hypothetical protein